MIKSYKIEVDCPLCASKIEEAAGKVEGVKALRINFITLKMNVEFEEGEDEAKVIKKILKIGKKIERDFDIEG